jgi:hypothetical protein
LLKLDYSGDTMSPDEILMEAAELIRSGIIGFNDFVSEIFLGADGGGMQDVVNEYFNQLVDSLEPLDVRAFLTEWGATTSQTDLNQLATEVINFVSRIPALKEYYPDKIGIVLQSVEFKDAEGDMSFERIKYVNYLISRTRERYKTRYQPYYFVRANFSPIGQVSLIAYLVSSN